MLQQELYLIDCEKFDEPELGFEKYFDAEKFHDFPELKLFDLNRHLKEMNFHFSKVYKHYEATLV